MPNLDAGDELVYHKVNRPHSDLSFEKMIEGLVVFRDEFIHQYWFEIFLLQNMTANDDQIDKLQNIADRISPDRIQLNTVTKPTWKFCPGAVPNDEMQNYCKLFGNKAEIIARYNKIDTDSDLPVSRENLIKLLKVQPCTLSDISNRFKINRMEIIKLIDGLLAKDKVNSDKKTENCITGYNLNRTQY